MYRSGHLKPLLCYGPELSSVGGAFTLQYTIPCLPPLNIHQSRTIIAGLKTHLFNQAYSILREHFVLKSVLYLLTYLLTYLCL